VPLSVTSILHFDRSRRLGLTDEVASGIGRSGAAEIDRSPFQRYLLELLDFRAIVGSGRVRARRSVETIGSLLLLLTLSVPFAPVRAQVPSRPSGIQPLPAGPFQLYPTFVAGVELTDNLFRSSRDPATPEPVPATITNVTPGIWAEMPHPGGGLNLGYTLRYRSYGRVDDLPSNLSHFFLAQGAYDFRGGFALEFTQDYRDGVRDAQDFDPGGEVVYRGDEFRYSDTELELSHGRGLIRRFGLRLRRQATDFDPETSSGFLFDSERYEAEAFVDRQFGYHGTVRFGAYFSDTDLSRVGAPDVQRKEETVGGVLRANWRFNPGSSLDAVIGYGQFDFTELNPGEERFEDSDRNWVGTVTFLRSVPARPVLTVIASQGVFTSIQANEFFFISRQLGVQMGTPSGTRVDIAASAKVIRNEYPRDPTGRSDEILRGRLRIGYRFAVGLDWGVFTDVEQRSSTDSRADYDVTRIGTTVVLRR
jgi:hypothetical protein